MPFHYDGSDLVLDAAHAFNSSLGLTATGRINLSSGQTSMTGTIVPAYFFNSMLGKLPLVGKLFSPEKGGGVFAARFDIEGQIDDPERLDKPDQCADSGLLARPVRVLRPRTRRQGRRTRGWEVDHERNAMPV